MADTPAKTGVDVAEYCRIHAARMEVEGYTKTALVLEWAAAEIQTLREELQQNDPNRP